MLDACRKLSPEQYAEPEPFEVGWPSIRSVVVHLAWASDLWVRRFLGGPSVPMIAEADLPTLDEAATLLMSAHDRFTGPAPPRAYARSDRRDVDLSQHPGRRLFGADVDGLRHVVNHGSYHRGQIASKLKRRGVDPPSHRPRLLGDRDDGATLIAEIERRWNGKPGPPCGSATSAAGPTPASAPPGPC